MNHPQNKVGQSCAKSRPKIDQYTTKCWTCIALLWCNAHPFGTSSLESYQFSLFPRLKEWGSSPTEEYPHTTFDNKLPFILLAIKQRSQWPQYLIPGNGPPQIGLAEMSNVWYEGPSIFRFNHMRWDSTKLLVYLSTCLIVIYFAKYLKCEILGVWVNLSQVRNRDSHEHNLGLLLLSFDLT